MYVKPKMGLNVRDPISLLHIAAKGVEVPESSYWLRRLRSGDVVACAPPVVLDPITDYRLQSSEKVEE